MAHDQECSTTYNEAHKHAEAAGMADGLQRILPIPDEAADQQSKQNFIQRMNEFFPDDECNTAYREARTAAAEKAGVLEQLETMRIPLRNADLEIKEIFIETVQSLAAAAAR